MMDLPWRSCRWDEELDRKRLLPPHIIPPDGYITNGHEQHSRTFLRGRAAGAHSQFSDPDGGRFTPQLSLLSSSKTDEHN